MFVFLIPAILQAGFATIKLDDGHLIQSTFVLKGTVSSQSGIVVKIGDMADIQSSLNGNSCLIRVSEIKDRFEQEVRNRIQRCDERLNVFRKSLDELQILNKNLKLDLKEEQSNFKKLLYGSIVTTVALSVTGVYLITR